MAENRHRQVFHEPRAILLELVGAQMVAHPLKAFARVTEFSSISKERPRAQAGQGQVVPDGLYALGGKLRFGCRTLAEAARLADAKAAQLAPNPVGVDIRFENLEEALAQPNWILLRRGCPGR